MFILHHTVSFELYVRAFQYKVLNSMLFTDTKLFKIGLITEDKCSFCKSESETLSHLSKEFVHLTWKDAIVRIVNTKCPLLNLLLLITKIYLWDCRRTQILPDITGFKLKFKNKYETVDNRRDWIGNYSSRVVYRVHWLAKDVFQDGGT